MAQTVKASAYSVGDQGPIPGSGRSLEKEMAPHSSTLAWRIPWTEEPGRLQSMGLQSQTGLRDFTVTRLSSLISLGVSFQRVVMNEE